MTVSQFAGNFTDASSRRIAWLLALPLVFFGLSLYLQKINGPYYVCNHSDPDYVYLYSSLNLATGVAPEYTDHPGTTLQIWGAVVLRSVHLIAGQGAFVADVVGRPEFYLSAIADSLMIISAVGLFFWGRAAWRAFGCGEAALLVQAAALFFPATMQYWPRVAPEALSLIVCQWLGVMWLGLAYGPVAAANSRRSAVRFGALAGAAMVTKLTFLPLLPAGLVQFGHGKARRQFLAGAAGFFVLLTLPIASHWVAMAKWLAQMATHQGMYGDGASGWPDLITYLRSIRWYMETYPVYSILAGWSLGVVLWFWLVGRQREQDPFLRHLGMTLTALLVFHAALLLIWAKQLAERYMMPSVGLLPLTALMAADFLWRARLRQSWRLAPAMAGVTAALFIARQGVVSVPALCRLLEEQAAQQTAIMEIADALSAKYLVVHCTWSSSPAFAESFGDMNAGHRYSDELTRRFPEFVGLDLFKQQYYRFGQVLAEENSPAAEALLHTRAGALFELGAPVYLQYWPVTLPRGYHLRKLYGMPEESPWAPAETLYWVEKDGVDDGWRQVQQDLRAVLARRSIPSEL